MSEVIDILKQLEGFEHDISIRTPMEPYRFLGQHLLEQRLVLQRAVTTIASLRIEVEILTNWQPIETAPEDVDLILAGVMDHPNDWRIKIGHRACSDEGSSYGFKIYGASWEPLLWKPLPSCTQGVNGIPNQ